MRHVKVLFHHPISKAEVVLCVNKHHVSEAYVGVKVQIHIFIILAPDGGEWRVSCADYCMPGGQPSVPIKWQTGWGPAILVKTEISTCGERQIPHVWHFKENLASLVSAFMSRAPSCTFLCVNNARKLHSDFKCRERIETKHLMCIVDKNLYIRCNNTAAQLTKPPNDHKTPPHNKLGIYHLTCNSCNLSYVGQTSRSLKVCYQEHIRYIRNNNPQSAYAHHILHNQHTLYSTWPFTVPLPPPNTLHDRDSRATSLIPDA